MIKINKSTGERLEFYAYSDVTVEHLHRYAIAKELAVNKKVVDIASGEGYGSYLISKVALSITGIDIDKSTIEEAKIKYKNPNLNFLEGRADKIPIKDNSVDVVVSFETIEHHDKHKEMFNEIKRILKINGVLIMSSPDRKYYSDKTNYKNPFHVKELYFEEFKSLTQNNFKNSNFYFQKSYNFNSYIFSFPLFEEINVYSGTQREISKTIIEPLYNITIASDGEIAKIENSIFNGNYINDLKVDQIIKKKQNYIKSTYSYRIGNFLLMPFFYFKKLFKKFLF